MSEAFNKWWNGDEMTADNNFEVNSYGYWAWEGWAAGVKAERNKWIRALDEEMVACHLGVFNAKDDPKTTLSKLITWNQDVALDPAVSSKAQELISKEREECVAWLRLYNLGYPKNGVVNNIITNCIEIILSRDKNDTR